MHRETQTPPNVRNFRIPKSFVTSAEKPMLQNQDQKDSDSCDLTRIPDSELNIYKVSYLMSLLHSEPITPKSSLTFINNQKPSRNAKFKSFCDPKKGKMDKPPRKAKSQKMDKEKKKTPKVKPKDYKMLSNQPFCTFKDLNCQNKDHTPIMGSKLRSLIFEQSNNISQLYKKEQPAAQSSELEIQALSPRNRKFDLRLQHWESFIDSNYGSGLSSRVSPSPRKRKMKVKYSRFKDQGRNSSKSEKSNKSSSLGKPANPKLLKVPRIRLSQCNSSNRSLEQELGISSRVSSKQDSLEVHLRMLRLNPNPPPPKCKYPSGILRRIQKVVNYSIENKKRSIEFQDLIDILNGRRKPNFFEYAELKQVETAMIEMIEEQKLKGLGDHDLSLIVVDDY